MARCQNSHCPGPKRPNFIPDQTGPYCMYCGRKLQAPPPPLFVMRRDQDQPKNSFEAAFRAYQRANPSLRTPIGREIGSLDVYPLILKELKEAFARAKRDFILYGSAALWLEGCPRPDNSPTQTIKDLDMGTLATDVKSTEQAILELVRGTIAGSVVDWGNPNHVFTSNQGTMEFVAADDLVQFSFSLQNPSGWVTLREMAELRRLPGTSTSIMATGLRYISAGLCGDDSMFARTLFRSDKTRKILTYTCLCLGYGTLKSKNIVNELVMRFAEAEWKEMKAQLSNISVDRHDKSHTEFFNDTKPLVDKLDAIKAFRTQPKLSEQQRRVEEELAQALEAIAQARLSRQRRQELITEKMKGVSPTLEPRQLKALQAKAAKEVREESDDSSYELACDLLIADAIRIWEGEVGTGILVFLLDQLTVVHSIITGCKWISQSHRATLLEGYAQLQWFVLREIDQRLETGNKARPKPVPTPQIQPQVQLQPQVLPQPQVTQVTLRVGEPVRIGYHLHYDVVGRITAIGGTPQRRQVTVRVEQCYAPGSTTPVRTDHTAIVLNQEMTWDVTPRLFSPL
ncbi:MAG TPA: hypothetical protein VK539_26155 [Myxococcaceae bacterium]|nr:hypothetical protein [Myxococcaceae bacterium]